MARKPMPVDVDAWLSSVRIMRLTPAEEGAYARLLFCAWATDDCTLPADDDELAALSRLGPLWSRSRLKLRDLFTHDGAPPGRLINVRQHKDFARIMSAAKPGRKKDGSPARTLEGVARGQYVVTTEAEHAKMVKERGEAQVAFAYELLDNYFGADERRLKKYTSHYRCLLSWVFDSEKFVKRFPPPPVAPSASTAPAGPVCKKCGKPLINLVCGPCGIDYTPKRR